MSPSCKQNHRKWKKASNTYKELLQEMKGEIAQGQITITELKGKLTMDVSIKFFLLPVKATVKKEGLGGFKESCRDSEKYAG